MSYLLWNTMPSSELIHQKMGGFTTFLEKHCTSCFQTVRPRDPSLSSSVDDVDAIDQTLIDIETYFPNDMAEEEGALFFVNALMQNAMMIEMDTLQIEVFERQPPLRFFLSSTGYIPEHMGPYYGVKFDTSREPVSYFTGHSQILHL